MKSFNILGDTHGRRHWEKLVDPSKINIFVGDYFDPYDPYLFDDMKQNFLDILQFAKTNPDTVLLFGNHDLHYIHYDDYSRLSRDHCKEIRELFESNAHLFTGIAYAITDNILVSHAGVTSSWLALSEYVGADGSANDIMNHCNSLLWDGFVSIDNRSFWEDDAHGMNFFKFTQCATPDDYCGTTPTQSPVWVRPQTLFDYTAMPNGTQIVGHTQFSRVVVDHPEIKNKIIFVDCLGQENPGSLVVNVNGDDIIYNVNNLKKS